MVQPNQYPGILKDIIGCLELVDDLKSLVYQCEYNLISVKDASSILQHGTSESRDVGTNVDIDEENLHLSTLATKENSFNTFDSSIRRFLFYQNFFNFEVEVQTL
jgi:hypothetical protein